MPTPVAIRIPETTEGSAAGNAMYRIRARFFVQPSIFPASTKIRGTLRKPLYELMRIGKTAPMKITNPAETVVNPNQMMANGIQAKRGDRAEDLDNRVDESVELPAPPHADTNGNTDEERCPEADKEVGHTHLEIKDEYSFLDKLEESGSDIDRAREEETVPDDQRRIAFPGSKCQHDRKSAKPPVPAVPYQVDHDYSVLIRLPPGHIRELLQTDPARQVYP